jgi:hypothetical protein
MSEAPENKKYMYPYIYQKDPIRYQSSVVMVEFEQI